MPDLLELPRVEINLEELMDEEVFCNSLAEHDCTHIARWSARGAKPCLLHLFMWCDGRYTAWVEATKSGRHMVCTPCQTIRKQEHPASEWIVNPI